MTTPNATTPSTITPARPRDRRWLVVLLSLVAMIALVVGLDAALHGRWLVVAVAGAVVVGYAVIARRILRPRPRAAATAPTAAAAHAAARDDTGGPQPAPYAPGIAERFLPPASYTQPPPAAPAVAPAVAPATPPTPAPPTAAPYEPPVTAPAQHAAPAPRGGRRHKPADAATSDTSKGDAPPPRRRHGR